MKIATAFLRRAFSKRVLEFAALLPVLAFPTLTEAQTPGSLDTSFAPGYSSSVNSKGITFSASRLYTCETSPSGTLVSGDLTILPDYLPYARLNGDGALEPTFINPQTIQFHQRRPLIIQPSGEILEIQNLYDGTAFTENVDYLLRADPNGHLDAAFSKSLVQNRSSSTSSRGVNCAIWLPEGKVLIGAERLRRFNSDGSLDASFRAISGPYGEEPVTIYALARQADGRILVSYSNGGFSSSHVVRLQSNGSLDSSFSLKAESFVEDIVIQPDGKIILAGRFTTIGGVARNAIARFNSNGTIDSGFAPLISHSEGYYSGPDDATQIKNKFADFNGTTSEYSLSIRASVLRLALQADGKIILFGLFDRWGTSPVPANLMRLNADGTRDTTFSASVDRGAGVNYQEPDHPDPSYRRPYTAWHNAGLALQADGKVLIGGQFTTVNGTSRAVMARLNNGAAIQSISFPGWTGAVWNRSGTCPELLGVTFEASTDGGNNWTLLGQAGRIGTTSNWQMTGLNLAPGFLRARGLTHRGGLVEQVQAYNPPIPTISSFTPTSGMAYDPVYITGTNFDSASAVKFNGTAAEFQIISPTIIVAICPPGVTPGKLSVTTAGYTVESAANYTANNVASGQWTIQPWTGDSTTGIPATDSAANGFLKQAFRFGSTTNAIVNGRPVSGAGSSGVIGSYIGVTDPGTTFPSTANNLTAQGGAGSALMAQSFCYGTDPTIVNLHNLIVGETYRTSFFSVGWEGVGRLVDFGSGLDHLTVDQDQYGQGNGVRVDYIFTATSADQTISIDAADSTKTWHLHAVTLVEVQPNKPTLTTLAATSITSNSAVLHGVVNANGSTTSPTFYYGDGRWSDYSVHANPWPVTGWSDTPVSATLTGLKGHTAYYINLFGSNAVGSDYGGVGSAIGFTTLNTVPVASDSFSHLNEDEETFIPLTTSDVDDDVLTATVVTPPAHGTVNFYTASTEPFAIYTPEANYTGVDQFSFEVSDGFGGTSTTATTTVNVNPVNDPPTIAAISNPAPILEDSGQQQVIFSGVSMGPNEFGQTVTVTATSSNTSLIPNPTVSYTSGVTGGSLSYTPGANANGSAVITVTVSDGLLTASTNFTVTVTPVNDPPVFALPAGVTPVAAVWIPRGTNRYWGGIASSADGTKLVAFEKGRMIYTSTDSGLTWTAQTGAGSRQWAAVASSANGQRLVAAEEYGSIYLSTDSGLTWNPQLIDFTSGTSNIWRSVASSSDGTKITATGSYVYTYTNGLGFYKASESAPRSWSAVACSGDGVKRAAVVYGGQIYTWTAYDSGSRVARETDRNWNGIASSDDGQKLAAIVDGGQIYTSTDAGVSWTPRDSNRNWRSITSSSNGTKLAAVAGIGGDPGQIYTSTDSGITWTAKESNRQWWSITSSADGDKLAAVENGGQIYTSAAAGYVLSTSLNAGAVTRSGFATDIASGPPDEAGQAMTFAASNDNSAIFSVQPALAANGTLTFTPTATGIATVTVTAHDNGGTASGGADTSLPQTFTIAINTSVPTVTIPTSTNLTGTSGTLGGNVTDDGGAAITERGVVYALTAANADPMIGGTGVTKVTAGGTTGVLTASVTGLSAGAGYTFKAYATSSLGTGYTSAAAFTATTPTAPTVTTGAASAIGTMSATLGGTVNANNASTSVALQYGMTTDYGQTATATVTPLTGLISASVSASVSGLLPHTLYHFRVSGTNSAGTTNGSDAIFSTPNTTPVATSQSGVMTNEDSAKAITLAGTDADGDLLTFAVATQPLNGSVTISGGTATYTPSANFSGSDYFTFMASDAFGGTSMPAIVLLTVSPVNHMPSFAKGADQSHLFGTSTTQWIPDWATSIYSGDDIVFQVLTFNVTVDNPTIFSALPRINSAGSLTYELNGIAGMAVVNVSLTDDENAGGSALTSAVQTFTITVAAPPEIAVTGNGVNIADGDATPSLADFTDFGSTTTTASTALRSFTINNSGASTLTLGTVTISGTNAADFSVTTQPASSVAPVGSATFQITFDPSATGLRTAALSFTTNDADENPFNFSIQGTGYDSTAEAEAATWAESYGLSPADAAPTAEPFDDGVPNLLKYAFNMALTGPNVSGLTPGTGNSGLPSITAPSTGGPPDSIRVEFIRRRNNGLIYTPLYSINGLSNFIPMTATPAVTIIDASWERVVVNQPLGLPLPTTTFSRVSVTAQ